MNTPRSSVVTCAGSPSKATRGTLRRRPAVGAGSRAPGRSRWSTGRPLTGRESGWNRIRSAALTARRTAAGVMPSAGVHRDGTHGTNVADTTTAAGEIARGRWCAASSRPTWSPCRPRAARLGHTAASPPAGAGELDVYDEIELREPFELRVQLRDVDVAAERPAAAVAPPVSGSRNRVSVSTTAPRAPLRHVGAARDQHLRRNRRPHRLGEHVLRSAAGAARGTCAPSRAAARVRDPGAAAGRRC